MQMSGLVIGAAIMTAGLGLASAAHAATPQVSISTSPHVMALRDDGRVFAWGANGAGQLGDGSNTNRPLPVLVSDPRITNIVQVAAGGYHSLALRSDGLVFAWGGNFEGELGDGTQTDSLTPIQVSGLTDVVAVAAGYETSYAIKADGSVWAWGFNGYGQIGNGTTIHQLTPLQVPSLSGFVRVASGQYHVIALNKDGSVWAWGLNILGALGVGSTTDSLVPLLVPGVTAVDVSAGDLTSMALSENGLVFTWGEGTDGQIGDGSAENAISPVLLPPGQVEDAVQLAKPIGEEMGIISGNGRAWTWGLEGVGGLGNGETNAGAGAFAATVPAMVPGERTRGLVGLSLGLLEGFFLRSDGYVRAVGGNGYGQLGINSFLNIDTPTFVLAPTGTATLNLGNRAGRKSNFVPNSQAAGGNLVFRDAGGNYVVWRVQGTSVTQSTSLGSVSSNWVVVGTGDVDADGRADIVLQDTTDGTVVIWFMNGNSVSSTVSLGSPGPAWAVIGVGDLDGDGRADLVFRNSRTNEIVVWYMGGAGTSVKGTALIGTLGSSWELVAVKDMDGNNHDDLLWFNTASTELVVWLMRPTPGFRAVSLGVGGAGWAPMLFGDFDGDGRNDILWRNQSTGATVFWYMNGANIRQVENYGILAPGWLPVAVGDYSGDGRDDVFWSGPGNVLVQYQMRGYRAAPIVTSFGSVGATSIVGQ